MENVDFFSYESSLKIFSIKQIIFYLLGFIGIGIITIIIFRILAIIFKQKISDLWPMSWIFDKY